MVGAASSVLEQIPSLQSSQVFEPVGDGLVPSRGESPARPGRGDHKVRPCDGRRRTRDQVWCADITYIPVSDGFFYLVAVMDWA